MNQSEYWDKHEALTSGVDSECKADAADGIASQRIGGRF
jgi:hypothetical protein